MSDKDKAEKTIAPWQFKNVVGIQATSRSQRRLVKKLLRKAFGDEPGEGLVTDVHSITIEMDEDWEETGIYRGFLFGSHAGADADE